MFKLMILLQPEIDQDAFFEGWPDFLKLAEKLPGLRRITTSPVHAHLGGDFGVLATHELIFDSHEDLELALSSERGEAMAKVLQIITGGAVTLLIAAHLEEGEDRLQTYRDLTGHPRKR